MATIGLMGSTGTIGLVTLLLRVLFKLESGVKLSGAAWRGIVMFLVATSEDDNEDVGVSSVVELISMRTVGVDGISSATIFSTSTP